jgi:MFS family permease
MVCADPFVISSFAMAFWIGMAIFSVILPNLSDKKGRKMMFFICLFICWLGYVVLIFLPSANYPTNPEVVYWIIFLMFILGSIEAGRSASGYAYFIELAPERYMKLTGTLWLIMDGSTYLWLTIYYRWIAKDWIPTIEFAVAYIFVCLLILLFYIPESPKWLYDKKRYAECQENLLFMAK